MALEFFPAWENGAVRTRKGSRTAILDGATLLQALGIVNYTGMGGPRMVYEKEFNLNSVRNFIIDDGGLSKDPVPLFRYLDLGNHTRNLLYGSGNEVIRIHSSPETSGAGPLSTDRHSVVEYLQSPEVWQ